MYFFSVWNMYIMYLIDVLIRSYLGCIVGCIDHPMYRDSYGFPINTPGYKTLLSKEPVSFLLAGVRACWFFGWIDGGMGLESFRFADNIPFWLVKPSQYWGSSADGLSRDQPCNSLCAELCNWYASSVRDFRAELVAKEAVLRWWFQIPIRSVRCWVQ